MSAPFLASITVLGGAGGAQPKGTGTTHLAMITPLSGDRPGHGLPESPVDPGFGGGWGGGAIDPGFGGGVPVPPEITQPLPPPAGDYGNQVIVAVYQPGKGWTAKAFPPGSMPQPK
jgi:hypothetical protein